MGQNIEPTKSQKHRIHVRMIRMFRYMSRVSQKDRSRNDYIRDNHGMADIGGQDETTMARVGWPCDAMSRTWSGLSGGLEVRVGGGGEG